jgi:hypothetical protein
MGFPMTVERVIARNQHDCGLFFDGHNDDIRRLAEDSATLAVAAYRADLRARILAAGLFVSCGDYGCTEGRNDDMAAVLSFLEPSNG